MLVTSANPPAPSSMGPRSFGPSPSTRGGEDPVGWSLVNKHGHYSGDKWSVIGQPPSAYQKGDVGKLYTTKTIMVIVTSNTETIDKQYNQFVGADDRI